jgi:Spy/CpxP family protein refolding chaperone
MGIPNLAQARYGERNDDYNCCSAPDGTWGWGGGNSLNESQQKTFEKIMTEHRNKVDPVHLDIRSKHMELNYLSQNAKTEPKTISALVQDIKTLEIKLTELRKETSTALQKELGMSPDQSYALMGGAGGRGEFRHKSRRHRYLP